MSGLTDTLRTGARIACILNCHANSARARDTKEQLEALLAKHDSNARLLVTSGEVQAPALAQTALADGATILVAAGGDGSVNAVASAALAADAVLGVIPLGTLNHFAKDAGIPLDMAEAVANIFHGRVTKVDVGQVNDHIFVNNSSIGLYPEIVRGREAAQARGEKKWNAFIKSAAFALTRYSKLHVRMVTDQHEIEERTPFIFVGNNEYALSGAEAGSRQRLDGGKLWIHGAPDASRARLLWLSLKSLLGVSDTREWHTFDAEQFRIDVRRHHLTVSIDGEVEKLQTPLNYRVLPQALKVIVPAEAAE